MAVFCNPETLVTIVRDAEKREELEAQGYVLVERKDVPAEDVKPAAKKSKKGAE